MRLNRTAGIAAALALWTGASWAHPHVYIDNVTTLVFAQGKIGSIKLRWVFDELFSASIIPQFDKNKDKKFDAEEMKALEAGAFSNLKNFNYFTWLTVDGKQVKVTAVTGFTAVIEKDKLVYEFTVPLDAPVDPVRQKFILGVYDYEYFVYVEMGGKEQVRYEGNGAIKCGSKMAENEHNPIYGGAVLPVEMHLTCSAP